jgi:hypothetical protein
MLEFQAQLPSNYLLLLPLSFRCSGHLKGRKMPGFMSKLKGWLDSLAEPDYEISDLPIDEQGFLRDDMTKGGPERPLKPGETTNHVVVAQPKEEKPQSLERIQENFNRFVDQLQGINANLTKQVAQQEQLGAKLDKLPTLIGAVPEMLENEHRSLDEVLRQLRASQVRSEEFIDIVHQIPREAVKQTETMQKMNQHMTSAAETDIVMRDAFTSFSETVTKLTAATEANREAILNMSKAFVASDRSMKFIVQVQNRRFIWLFMISIGICLVCVLAAVAAFGLAK